METVEPQRYMVVKVHSYEGEIAPLNSHDLATVKISLIGTHTVLS